MRGGRHNAGWRLAGLALGWLAGVALQMQERALLAPASYAICAAVGVAGLLAAWRWRSAFVAALVGLALLAFAVTGVRATWRLADSLDAALEGRDIVVTGIVASLPQRGPTGIRFRFEVEGAALDGRAVVLPSQLAIGWYKGQHEDATLSPSQTELRAGQRWRFTLRLRQPHGNLNPHGFDYELHLFEQGLRATGYVRDAPAELLDPAAGHPVERLRQRVRDAIDAAVSDRRAAGVLAALSVGDQSAIQHDDWELFRNTGIAHLVSISGLHVTMFAWLSGLAVAWLWRRSPRAMLWRPAPLAARWGGLAAALGYAVFSGWGVPSQRTVWMLAVVTLLQASGRRWPWPLVLTTAAMVVTMIDPWAVLQAGFWLSFAAVGLLMASGAAQDRGPVDVPSPAGRLRRHLHGELRSQIVATLGLTPLTLVFFHQVSLVGFIANLIAIPLVTLVITPLALLGALATPLWWAGAWLVQMLCALLTWLAAWPRAVWQVPAAPWWAQAAGLLAGLLLIMPLPWRLRLLALPLVLPLLVPPLVRPDEGRFELLAVDVGQGTAVLVRTRTHLLVYDSGPRYSPESDAGQRVLLPLLRARGDTRIDRLVLSHRDLDHVGGASSLMRDAEVVEVSSSLDDDNPLRAIMPRHTRCEAGQSWTWDGVRFDMLAPAAGDFAAGLKSNAMSCVLRVIDERSASVLLAGDIERQQELRLVAQLGRGLASDVLIVPHHGSKTSSSEPFLDAVTPRLAVFQAGYRNRFNHPAAEVVERYRGRSIEAFASPSCGAWRWVGDDAPGVCERDIARRYWHHRTDAGRLP